MIVLVVSKSIGCTDGNVYGTNCSFENLGINAPEHSRVS